MKGGNMKEVYKAVKGYENIYEVSDSGKIRNAKTRKALTPQITRFGYLRIQLHNNKVVKNYFVHNLVANAFIDNPLNKRCVNHLDGNKQNNTLSNLERCSHSENTLHAFRIGLCDKTGIKNNNAKIEEIDVLAIRYIYKSGLLNQKEIGSFYNLSQGNIGKITRNHIWAHIS
jgi:hypothetical protein